MLLLAWVLSLLVLQQLQLLPLLPKAYLPNGR
jgi:hypothetical protein